MQHCGQAVFRTSIQSVKHRRWVGWSWPNKEVRRGASHARPGTAAESRIVRRSAFRPLHPRALCHRRFPLSDHAGGMVAPRTIEEAERAIGIAREEGARVLARGGGTSQCGQAIGEALVVDCSKYLNRMLDLDVAQRRCTVEPGIVLDELNRQLKPHGLWFPVDISTASRATIGGMAGNNSCGGRSMRYGTTRDNVLSIEALLADGTSAHFGPVGGSLDDVPSPLRPLAKDLLAIGAREAAEIEARVPKVQRRVGGYNVDALVPGKNDINLAHVLVG